LGPPLARGAVYAGGGGLAVVALYAALLTLWHPRNRAAERAEPRTLSRPAAVPGRATLLFAGDTLLGADALPALERHGLTYPFGSTLPLVAEADVAVVNAEGPITDGGHVPVVKQYVYRAPAAVAQALADAGFDVVTLANNHVTDYGADGLADTLANLGRAGLGTLGAGADDSEARRGLVVDVGGLRVGLLAYCERDFLWNVWVDQFARAGHPGAAALREPDLERDVARLRARADLVVVQLHIGDNYAPPTARALEWSRRAVAAGADLVVNHHPHVAHPIMTYRGRPIVLSLGNYAFGTEANNALDYGLLAFARARRCPDGRAVFERVEIVPLAVQNGRVQYRPEPLTGAELDRELAALRARSAAYGAALTVADGRARLPLPGCEGAP
jgi:poly-gamma-glutamate synthesis protein (capsule biosynthesis protein)